MKIFFKIIAALALLSLPLWAQITNVQCGNDVTNTWTACPANPPYPPTTTVGGIDTTQPSTGAFVAFKWQTPTCSSTVLVWIRDINHVSERYFQGDAGGNDGCAPGYAKNHSVRADHLVPSYDGLTVLGNQLKPFSLSQHGTFFYVASQDQNHTGANDLWITLGGPCMADTMHGCAPYGVALPIPDTTQSPVWGLWIYGAQNVYQGDDLWLALFNVLAQGPGAGSVVMPWSSVQWTRLTMPDGSACMSNCADVQDGRVFNLDLQLVDSQAFSDSPGSDYTTYMIDSAKHWDWSYAGNFRALTGTQALRVRLNCNGHGSQAACGQAAPTPLGSYKMQAQFQPLAGRDTGAVVGQPITLSYTFTVSPMPTPFVANPPACLAAGNCPPVPCELSGSCGGYNYEDEIKNWGVINCTGGPRTWMSRLSREYTYSIGNMDVNAYGANTSTELAGQWNYDNTRAYLDAADRADLKGWAVPAGASLQPNGQPYPSAGAYFRHCASISGQAYRDFYAGVGAAGTLWPGGTLREWNIFPNGAAMLSERTGSIEAKQAVLNMGSMGGTGGTKQGSTIYRYFPLTAYDQARQTPYQMNAILAAWQINNSISAMDRYQLKRLATTLMGGFDQTINNDPYGRNYGSIQHPQTWPFGMINRNYMLGVGMEALAEYYDWQGVVGEPQDPRIPVAIKAMLDYMWNRMWAVNSSGYHAFYYDGYDLPHGPSIDNDGFTLLNNIVCSSFAWYWAKSGDDTYRTRGDDCWQNGVGQSAQGQIYFTGKDFGQMNKAAADYIGYRSKAGFLSSTFPASNPPVPGGVPDTVPPVSRPMVMTNTTTTDSPVDQFTGVKPVTAITSSSVKLTWSTYKQLQRVEVDYGSTANYGSVALGVSTSCTAINECHIGCSTVVGSIGQSICNESYWNTVTISGLLPSSTYHFRVLGKDMFGNIAVSNTFPGTTGSNKDFTFVTAAGGSKPPAPQLTVQ